jgi:hypothetical protein
VEKGDLLFYVQRSGCFDENNEYLKLGRIRLRLDPNSFGEHSDFRQELKLQQGHIEITGINREVEVKILVWAEAHRPVVYLEIECSQAVHAEVAYESWRNNDIELSNDGKNSRFGCFSWDEYPGQVVRYKDGVSHQGNAALAYHRNRDDKLLFDFMVRQQGLESAGNDLINTQKGRTFGRLLTGTGFAPAGSDKGEYIGTPHKAWKLRSESVRSFHTVKLYTHLAQTETLDESLTDLNVLATVVDPSDREARK